MAGVVRGQLRSMNETSAWGPPWMCHGTRTGLWTGMTGLGQDGGSKQAPCGECPCPQEGLSHSKPGLFKALSLPENNGFPKETEGTILKKYQRLGLVRCGRMWPDETFLDVGSGTISPNPQHYPTKQPHKGSQKLSETQRLRIQVSHGCITLIEYFIRT